MSMRYFRKPFFWKAGRFSTILLWPLRKFSSAMIGFSRTSLPLFRLIGEKVPLTVFKLGMPGTLVIWGRFFSLTSRVSVNRSSGPLTTTTPTLQRKSLTAPTVCVLFQVSYRKPQRDISFHSPSNGQKVSGRMETLKTACASEFLTNKTVNHTMNLAEKEKDSDSQTGREGLSFKGNHKSNMKRTPALCAVTDP